MWIQTKTIRPQSDLHVQLQDNLALQTIWHWIMWHWCVKVHCTSMGLSVNLLCCALHFLLFTTLSSLYCSFYVLWESQLHLFLYFHLIHFYWSNLSKSVQVYPELWKLQRHSPVYSNSLFPCIILCRLDYVRIGHTLIFFMLIYICRTSGNFW